MKGCFQVGSILEHNVICLDSTKLMSDYTMIEYLYIMTKHSFHVYELFKKNFKLLIHKFKGAHYNSCAVQNKWKIILNKKQFSPIKNKLNYLEKI